MKNIVDKEIEKALQDVMRHRAMKLPPLPEDFSQRVINNIKAHTRHTHHYRLWTIITSVAASVILVVLLWPKEHHTKDIKPIHSLIIAKTPTPRPITKDVFETKTISPQPNTIHKRKPIINISSHPRTEQPTPEEHTTLIETETNTPSQSDSITTYYSDESNPFILAAIQAQNIRSRGECLYQKVALMTKNQL